MAEAMILRRGGGSTQSLDGRCAVIGVEYPAGSICTCEKGGVILRARGTGGAAAFNIPETGSWTVRCTDGSQSAVKTVNITAQGQVKTVTLSYSRVILRDGVLTQGYSIIGNASLENGIQESENGGFYLTPAIDLTDVNSVTVTGIMTYAGASGYTSRVGFSSTPGDGLQQTDFECSVIWRASEYGSAKTMAISTAGLSGEYYLCSARVGNQIRLSEIYLN